MGRSIPHQPSDHRPAGSSASAQPELPVGSGSVGPASSASEEVPAQDPSNDVSDDEFEPLEALVPSKGKVGPYLVREEQECARYLLSGFAGSGSAAPPRLRRRCSWRWRLHPLPPRRRLAPPAPALKPARRTGWSPAPGR